MHADFRVTCGPTARAVGATRTERIIARTGVIVIERPPIGWNYPMANDDGIDTDAQGAGALAACRNQRGDPDMRATRNRWIGFLFAGACMAAVPAGLPGAHAQGFGPDPYQPYNSQYQQYVISL